MISRGTCVLVVALVMALGTACVEQEPDRPNTEDIKLIGKHILKTAPKLKYQVNADLEGKVVYLGMDVDKELVKPGVPFLATHYWKVVKAVPGWKIFVHLNDPKGKRFINADHKPVGGRYPATFWKPGEIVRDEHRITLPSNWKDSKVIIHTGLWRGKMRMKPKGPKDAQNRVIAATLNVTVGAKAPDKPLPRLVAAKAAKEVKVDGKLDDEVWKKAMSGKLVDTRTGRPAAIQSEIKVAWDDKYLYVAFDNVDDDVWGDFKKRDDKLWTQEAVEVFIDANGDGKDYVELQVNPHGTIFDSYLPEHRKNQNDWNSKLQVKVTVDGTLKRGDKDKGWVVEMAIPWADVKGKGTYALKLPPEVGNTWRVNFFRMDAPAKGRKLAAAWSAPLSGDFHELARFGNLVFGDEEGKAPVVKQAAAIAPPATPAVVPPNRKPVGRVVRMAVPARRSLAEMRRRKLMRPPNTPANARSPRPRVKKTTTPTK